MGYRFLSPLPKFVLVIILKICCTFVTAFHSTVPILDLKCSCLLPSFQIRLEASSSSSVVDSVAQDRTPEEEAFFQNTKILCSERNIPFDCIKNARDLASVRNSPIIPNRVFRSGRVSDASEEDLKILFGTPGTDEVGIRTFVDLRSPTELKDDLGLENEQVYGDFSNLIWSERKGGLVRELNGNEPRIPIDRNPRASVAATVKNRRKQLVRRVQNFVRFGFGKDRSINVENEDEQKVNGQVTFLTAAADLAAVISETNDDDLIVQEPKSSKDSILRLQEEEDGGEEIDDCCAEETLASMTESSSVSCRFIREFPPGSINLPSMSKSRGTRKERHFVSLMNELKYVRGTLSKLRKRDIVRVLVQSPGAIVSRRVRANCKDVFLSEINEGGLPMLNELILKMGSSGIKYVLELCADTNRHPVAFYCAAGKDRTGVIALLILSVLGVSEEDIIEDYSLSANVYAEMNDHKAMVGALKQRSVDPKTFLGAPPEAMEKTLSGIKENYGSVNQYLDSIGFGAEQRQQLKEALLS